MSDLDKMVDELAKRKNARESFQSYCEYIFPEFECSWHHQLIINHIERMLLPDGHPDALRRLCVSMPPRHGKSELISRLLPSYLLGRDPDEKVMACSYSAELSGRINRDVQRYIAGERFKMLFPLSRLPEGQGGRGGVTESYTRTTDLFEMVGRKGFYRSAGVGGSITGMGGKWLIVDDPIRNRQDADSPTVRDNILNWYKSTFRTRAEKDARILIVMCMTGDTQVLMGDGTQKELRCIKVGDQIATYDSGCISTSVVKNWVNQGKDKIYAVRMKSGIIVKANERHPFLTQRKGGLEWIRLTDLQVSDKIVKVDGASGKESYAAKKDATDRQPAWECAPGTMASYDGKKDIGVGPPPHQERLDLKIDTESPPSNTDKCVKRKTGCALYANSPPVKMCGRTGEESSASIIATEQGKSEGFCATTATSQLDTGKHLKCLNGPLSIYETTLDEILDICEHGYEDVFDIEVDRTENFIANGLVSHNTRWNPEDLVGSVLSLQSMDRGADHFEYLCLPAVATVDRHTDDPRSPGQPLWPTKYDLAALDQIKVSLGAREFEALYQQNPTAPGATEWSADLFGDEIWWDKPWPKRDEMKAVTIAIDPSKGTESKNGDYCAIVAVGRLHDNTVVVNPFISRMSAEAIVDTVLEMSLKMQPDMVVCESNSFQHLLVSGMNKKADNLGLRLLAQGVHNTIKKEVRIRRLGPFLEQKRFRIMKNSYGQLLMDQLRLFPSARYDDGPDALELALRTLISVSNNKHRPPTRGLRT